MHSNGVEACLEKAQPNSKESAPVYLSVLLHAESMPATAATVHNPTTPSTAPCGATRY